MRPRGTRRCTIHGKGSKYPDQPRVGNALLTAYVRAGKTVEATALMAAQVRVARERFPADSLQLAAALADTGQALLDAKAYADAEPLLRESLSIREMDVPDPWQTHHARSVLGEALLGQKKYPDAEPLLLKGYEGMKQRAEKMPPHAKDLRLQEALERLVQLYEAMEKKDEAAKWREELEAQRKVSEKVAPPDTK